MWPFGFRQEINLRFIFEEHSSSFTRTLYPSPRVTSFNLTIREALPEIQLFEGNGAKIIFALQEYRGIHLGHFPKQVLSIVLIIPANANQRPTLPKQKRTISPTDPNQQLNRSAE